MRKFTSLAAAVYFFASSAVLLCIGALLLLLTFWFDRNRRIVHYFSCWWAQHYLYLNPRWRTRYEGLENIDPAKTYVLVANHQSLVDILVLYGLYRPYKWVSKEEIFKVPLVGTNMVLNQYVLIKRGDLKSIKEMMQTCRSWLKRGASILMFPEGTRSEDGEIQEFKDGPFRLAADCGVPVVPIVVDGTHDILPKHGKLIDFQADIWLKVLPPVNPQDFGNKSTAVRDHVRELMKTTLAEMRSQKKALAASSS